MKSADAIAFDYRPSRLLAALCLLMLGLGLGALWSSQLGRFPLWAGLLSLAAIAAVALSLRQRSWLTALRQALKVLAGQAQLRGVSMDEAETPLVQ